MTLRKRFWVFWIVSCLPALSAIAVDYYVWRAVFRPDYYLPWRFWALLEIVAVGAAVPRLGARLAAMIVLIGLIAISGFSIGLLYTPTLALAVVATLVQMESDGKWSTLRP